MQASTKLEAQPAADSPPQPYDLPLAADSDTRTCDWLSLPSDLVREFVLPHLSAHDLLALSLSHSSYLGLVESFAKQAVLRTCRNDPGLAGRFRHRSWKERLYLERAACGFGEALGTAEGFVFTRKAGAKGKVTRVTLTGVGPKLLVSDLSTKDAPSLRWHLRVKGNTAVEFGIVPLALQKTQTALHKAQSVGGHKVRAMGFCSQITAGSSLGFRTHVLRGSVVEIAAMSRRLEVILYNPDEAKEVHWINGQPATRSWRGPNEVRFELEIPSPFHFKLACTAWAKSGPNEVRFELDIPSPFHFKLACTAWAKSCFDVLETAGEALDMGVPYSPQQGNSPLFSLPSFTDTACRPQAAQQGPLGLGEGSTDPTASTGATRHPPLVPK
ncbi:hypothetical protein WJX72_004081 [[Myrmecia] bisecta]|uniref:F-box domain-containing protein n=1 Tax=[Myrmecia] bisecta TaxID=41462 RepID=A0AAW1QR80_9CHLO